jgi:hypothetical protein
MQTRQLMQAIAPLRPRPAAGQGPAPSARAKPPRAAPNEAAPPCATDLDGDGQTSGADLALLLNSWGAPKRDLDGDGTVSGADLALLLNGWGACP